MTANDLELLRQFTRDHSQDAFTTLVQRHVNLVYSAALRQVRSPHLAEEIAQAVFNDLARAADRLKPDTILTAWLYQVARRTAIDAVRQESRRQLREQIAVEMTNMNATANEWTQIEPLLDDAVAALADTDRSAILLRYFENKNLREVGEALGTSDDAAQKRVSRAVEQLREFFAKRGVTVGAGGLAVVISANAVQAAPAGLAATISAAPVLAGIAVHTSTVIAATKTIAMTALQKTLVTATVAVLAGAGIYEARQTAQLRDQVQTLQQQQAPLAEQIQQLQKERNEATNRMVGLSEELVKANSNSSELLKLRAEVTRLRNSEKISTDTSSQTNLLNDEIKFWLVRVEKLKNRLQQFPDKKIPEFDFMTPRGWVYSSQLVNSESDSDFDNAIQNARAVAKRCFADAVYDAIKKFKASNSEGFPSDFSQIQSYLPSAADASVFQRYEFLQAQLVPEIISSDNPTQMSVQYVYHKTDANSVAGQLSSKEWVVMQKTPLDENDAQIVVSSTGVKLQKFQP